MNGTGLVFVTILIVVLIAVAWGGSQIQADLTSKIDEITSQRDTTLQVALEAKSQRDGAFQVRDVALGERDAARAELDKANQQIAALKAENEKVALDLNTSKNKVEEQSKQIETLQNDNAGLQANLDQAQKALASIPTTGSQPAAPQASVSSENALCLPVRADALPNQLGIGLAVLIGMMALGSGGYIVFRHDPSRKYTVKLTKEQIRDYARYQRERGNRAN